MKYLAMANAKVVFITGANTGLGLEIVKSLCRSTSHYHILLGCRTHSKGEAAIEEVQKQYPSTSSSLSLLEIDLSSDGSIEKAVHSVSTQFGRIDVLLNNAGASFDRSVQQKAMTIREAWNASWDVNVSGTHVLTALAVPLLLKSSDPRLIFMTSGASSLTESESSASDMLKRLNTSPPQGWPKETLMPIGSSYRSSKAGLNMLMREWAKILRNDGVKVWCISPGFLATGLGGIGSENMKKVESRSVVRKAYDILIAGRWVLVILRQVATSLLKS